MQHISAKIPVDNITTTKYFKISYTSFNDNRPLDLYKIDIAITSYVMYVGIIKCLLEINVILEVKEFPKSHAFSINQLFAYMATRFIPGIFTMEVLDKHL